MTKPEPESVKRLILASKSPRRKELLEQLGLRFDLHDSNITESVPAGSVPEEIVEQLAMQKAEAAARSIADALIVAADTVVVLDGKILGKPSGSGHAREMLSGLSGRTHTVFTGVCMLKTDDHCKITGRLRFHEQTKVTFAPLSAREIDHYVKGGSPLDKAGAYGIQDDWGSVFVSNIDGDYYNVVGFPLHKFYQHLKMFAPKLLNGLLSEDETPS